MDDPIKRAKNGDTDYFKRTPVEEWGNVLDWGEGDTVFGHAIANHHIHCSKAIYARCPELLHQQSKIHKYSVLHHAAYREETSSLLKFIISVADRGMYRMPFVGAISCLHHCIYHCRLGSARLLIEVDPDHLSHIDSNGETPLLYALRLSYGKSVDHDSVKMRRLLLEKHPNASKIRTGEHGWTALHHSSSEGDVSALEDIIQFCPDSVHMVDNDGHSFLDIAIRYKQDEVVNYVLQSKELRACIPQGKLKQEIEKIALYFNFHHKKEVKEKKKKKKFLYKPSWMTKNMREMKLCIPSKYLHLYRKLVKEFGEIVLPNVPSTTLMENDPACLALGCFLGDVAEIVNSKPREVSQEQILEWEKMGKQYSALGLQVNWFQKLVAEYSNWFAKKTQYLVHLDDELATKTDKLNIKYAELQELETELEELHEQRDTYKAESDQTKFGLQVRLNTYSAWRIKLPLRIAKLPLRSRKR